MSFTQAFKRKIRAVRIRCSLNLLLHQTGRVLAAAGVAAILMVLAEKLLAVSVRTPALFWTAGTLAAALILIPWLLRIPNRMQASLLLDERLRLKERFSTTLALAESDDPFARAARAESLRAIERADLKGSFPFSLSRSWHYGAGAWLIVVALFFLLPQKDLLGFVKDRQKKEKEALVVEQAQAEVKRTAAMVKAAVEDLGDPNLAEDLKKLEELAQAGTPENAKRQAIKALGDLSEKIEKMQGGAKVDAADALQQMLKRLRGSANPFSQKMRMAMAKGDFAQAANMLRQLQQELAEGKVPAEKREELAKAMQELAKELERLAEEQKELEKELEKLGLDKKLAQMTPEQLRQALQKQGLTNEMIAKLMQKMAACQAAQGSCSALSEAMAAAAGGGMGLGAEDLSSLVDQLNAVEAMQMQAVMLRASLGEIRRCMGQLGAGMCEGSTPGGEEAGLEAADSYFKADSIQSDTKMTRSVGKSDAGPTIASWYFKDEQVKGEARREFSEVLQAGQASAAEAISENEIPRRYEGPVKKYFNQLEESGPKP